MIFGKYIYLLVIYHDNLKLIILELFYTDKFIDKYGVIYMGVISVKSDVFHLHNMRFCL